MPRTRQRFGSRFQFVRSASAHSVARKTTHLESAGLGDSNTLFSGLNFQGAFFSAYFP